MRYALSGLLLLVLSLIGCDKPKPAETPQAQQVNTTVGGSLDVSQNSYYPVGGTGHVFHAVTIRYQDGTTVKSETFKSVTVTVSNGLLEVTPSDDTKQNGFVLIGLSLMHTPPP